MLFLERLKRLLIVDDRRVDNFMFCKKLSKNDGTGLNFNIYLRIKN